MAADMSAESNVVVQDMRQTQQQAHDCTELLDIMQSTGTQEQPMSAAGTIWFETDPDQIRRAIETFGNPVFVLGSSTTSKDGIHGGVDESVHASVCSLTHTLPLHTFLHAFLHASYCPYSKSVNFPSLCVGGLYT